jgi:hypothetical protein
LIQLRSQNHASCVVREYRRRRVVDRALQRNIRRARNGELTRGAFFMEKIESAHNDRSVFWGWVFIGLAAIPIAAGLVWKKSTQRPIDRPATAAAPAQDPNRSPFADWGSRAIKLDGRAAEAPDGSMTATRLTEDMQNRPRGVWAGIALDLPKAMKARVHARNGDGRRLLFSVAVGKDAAVRCDVDLENGNATVKSEGAARSATCTATAENGGWWRVEMNGDFSQAVNTPEQRVGISLTTEPFVETYVGSGEGHIFIWNGTVTQ